MRLNRLAMGFLGLVGATGLWIAVSSLAAPSQPGPPFAVSGGVRGAEAPVGVGSVVAAGRKEDGNCVFAQQPVLRIDLGPDQDASPRVSYEIDGECRLVITAITADRPGRADPTCTGPNCRRPKLEMEAP